jgi:hypothetical protein
LIDAQVMGENLEITLSGGDAWLFALRTRWSLSVPLSSVLQATTGDAIGRATRRHVNERRNDRLRLKGRLVCARVGAPTLRIELDEGPYRRMVLSVPDPASTAQMIQDAIAARPR